MQHTLLFGKPLRAFHTKVDFESVNWLRKKNSGMVTIERIGQSACLLPKSIICLAHGRASETERVWVDKEGPDNQSRLKIQSTPLGKLRGSKVLTATKQECKSYISIKNDFVLLHHIRIMDASTGNNKQQCSNCKCWRDTLCFIGKRGSVVKSCTKCREKDARMKQKPDVKEKRNFRQREKKYYISYREKKRMEDEHKYLEHNANIMKAWRYNNKEHISSWQKQNVNYRLSSIKQQASKKGYVWEISDEHAKNLMLNNCHYCGWYNNECVNGIDRMDNTKGYIDHNVVSCCKTCNFIKKALDSRTFIERCQHISAIRNKMYDTLFPNAWPTTLRASYSSYKSRAVKKCLAFDISEEQFVTISSNPCFYCNKCNSTTHKNGIDRKDNLTGYTTANCIACCSECNRMKSNIDIEQFFDTCSRVSNKAKNGISIPTMQRNIYTNRIKLKADNRYRQDP
jgi:hypothetical protein